MALRLSTGLRNFLMQNGSTKQALQNGVLRLYTGSQPADADTAPSGTLLVEISAASGARTAEVCGTGSVTLTGGGAGTVDSITVNSVQLLAPYAGAAAVTVAYDTDLNTTATSTAARINDGTWHHGYAAGTTGSSAVITLTAVPGKGASVNTHVVAFTGTTITGSAADIASGVNPVNGLDLSLSVAGVLSKSSGVWSGVAGNTGTAGYFRFTGSIADAGGSSTTLVRLDGSVATSGANLNMSSTTVTASTTTTIDTFALTEPAA